jgi:hypothetical protein
VQAKAFLHNLEDSEAEEFEFDPSVEGIVYSGQIT